MGLFVTRGLIIYNQATTLASLRHTGGGEPEVIRGHVTTRTPGILLVLRTSTLDEKLSEYGTEFTWTQVFIKTKVLAEFACLQVFTKISSFQSTIKDRVTRQHITRHVRKYVCCRRGHEPALTPAEIKRCT